MISSRVDRVIKLKRQFTALRLYCSSVIMRIPHYNGDSNNCGIGANMDNLSTLIVTTVPSITKQRMMRT